MAGTLTDYWRIVKPQLQKNNYINQEDNISSLHNSFSWYSKLLKGASSRQSKYKQYRAMDEDTFVSRALDTIAEEMTPQDEKYDLPFNINYQNEVGKEVPEQTVVLLKAALRHWCNLHYMKSMNFDIARSVIKYGDVFFKKTSDFRQWEYLPPENILGVELDKKSRKIKRYQIQSDDLENGTVKSKSVEFVPAGAIVHFTLASSVNEVIPYGESVLSPTVKAYRHLSLLEDAVIIYRIVRAPERRVFFLDVGNMPPQRVKSYLESVKNEVKQKRMPNNSGGEERIDGVGSPLGMTDDYYFAQTANGRGSRVETLPGGECLSLDTKIKLLDSRDVELSTLIDEFNSGKENWVYSCHPTTGKVVPGKITWAGVTRKNAEVMRITFDNGESVTCTPDHKFPIKDIGFVEAKDLNIGQSMIPLYLKDEPLKSSFKTEYVQVYENESGEWEYVHRLVAKFLKDTKYSNNMVYDSSINTGTKVIHHANFNKNDNNPTNLVWMDRIDHWKYHSSINHIRSKKASDKMKWLKENDKTEYDRIITAQQDGLAKWRSSLSQADRLTINKKQSVAIKKYFETIDEHQRSIRAEISRKNFLKGTESLIKKLKDPEYKESYIKNVTTKRLISRQNNPDAWLDRNKRIGQSNTNRWLTLSDEEKQKYRNIAKDSWNRYKESNNEGFILRNKRISENAKLNAIKKCVSFNDRLLEICKNSIRDYPSLFPTRDQIALMLSKNEEFVSIYNGINVGKNIEPITKYTVLKLCKYAGFVDDWKSFRKSISFKNHKIVSIEYLNTKIDTGTITVDGLEELHDYHTFGLSCGVFTKNSLGQISDLSFFQNKFLQGLRIPSSYMKGSDDSGSVINDGKVGIAYIEELRFSNYIKRLQHKIEHVFDDQFKIYLKAAGIKIDSNIFNISLPDPQNFALYRQSMVDQELVNTYNNLKEDATISSRFAKKRYLGWSEDDIQANEILLKQEKSIPDNGIPGVTDIRMMYDKEWIENKPKLKISDGYDNFEQKEEDIQHEAPDSDESTINSSSTEPEELESDDTENEKEVSDKTIAEKPKKENTKADSTEAEK